jgi:hypothetical protein
MNGLTMNQLCCLFCCPPFPSHIVAKLAFLPPSPTYKLIISDDQTVFPVPTVTTEQTALQSGNNNNNNNNNNTSSTNSTSNSTNNNNRSNRAGIGKYFNSIFSSDNSAQNGGQLIQQLHVNAKLQLTEKAEWQYGPMELERLEVFLTRTEQGHQISCMHVRCTSTPKFTFLFSHGNAVDIGQMSSFYYGLGCRLECNIFTYDYSGYGASDGKPTEKNLYADIRAAWNALRIRYGISPSNIILYGQSIGNNSFKI